MQGILGAGKFCRDAALAERHVVHDPAGQAGIQLLPVRREVVEATERVCQVWRAHAAQGPGCGVVDRKICRDLDHRRGNPGIGEVGPERHPHALVDDARAAHGEFVVAQAERASGWARLPDREVRFVGQRIAHDEVRDRVTARIRSGDESAPSHGAQRRHGCAQLVKRAHRRKLAEVRSPPLVHQGLDDLGVEAVQAEHDHPAAISRGPRFLTAADRCTGSSCDQGSCERPSRDHDVPDRDQAAAIAVLRPLDTSECEVVADVGEAQPPNQIAHERLVVGNLALGHVIAEQVAQHAPEVFVARIGHE